MFHHSRSYGIQFNVAPPYVRREKPLLLAFGRDAREFCCQPSRPILIRASSTCRTNAPAHGTQPPDNLSSPLIFRMHSSASPNALRQVSAEMLGYSLAAGKLSGKAPLLVGANAIGNMS